MPKLKNQNIILPARKSVSLYIDVMELKKFKDKLYELEIPINRILETVMECYIKEEIDLSDDTYATEMSKMFSAYVSIEMYKAFSEMCKLNGSKTSTVIDCFIKNFNQNKYDIVYNFNGIKIIERKCK